MIRVDATIDRGETAVAPRAARLVVFSHKECWADASSPSGYATDGGFPFQMRAISECFESTTLLLPRPGKRRLENGTPLSGRNLRVAPLTHLGSEGLRRKAIFPFWLLRNLPTIARELGRADAAHCPIPSDIGTLGMVGAYLLGFPLFVRYCGDWTQQKTATERFDRWFLDRVAGDRVAVLATGGATEAPSARNSAISWIFSTSLTERELDAHACVRRAPGDGSARIVLVARQTPEKGAGRVIAALPHLVERFRGATLDVVGDGPALGGFRQQARDLGLADRVTFHGNVGHERVLDLLRAADVFCMPTTVREGFPKAVLEALACGLPVVTTRVSVLPMLVDRGCGVLLADVDPETIARAITHCVEDDDRYTSMSRRAVETAREFSLERWRDTIAARLEVAWGRR